MANIHIGIDPGKSGAIAVIENGVAVDHIKCSETDHDLSHFLRNYSQGDCHATIEKVSAMPRQGVASTFKFGRSFGFLEGLLVAHLIPYELVTPQKWQTFMKCRSGGDKNMTKAASQRLWPDIKMTHAIADAYLIAEYGRRTYKD